jgi:TolA-binding protein
MGLKPVCVLITMLIGLTACPRQKPPVARAAPVSASRAALETANRDFSTGAYGNALRSYEQYLSLVPSGGQRDEALFHLGLIYAMPGDPRQDWQRASSYLTRLVTEFPSSPLKPAAELILAMRKETVQLTTESQQRDQRIRQLNTELERLIRIDSERRDR